MLHEEVMPLQSPKDDSRAAQLLIEQARLITALQENEARCHRYTDELEALVAARAARIAELEAQRAQSEKLAALGQLAAGVAHEINNPMAGIKNAFLLVKPAIAVDYPHYEFVAMIEREIDRVCSIVQQLYRLYQPDLRQPEDIELRELFDEVAALVEGPLARRQLTLRTVVAPSVARLRLSQGELLQVLLNLIHNAIDASPLKRSITLDAGVEGGEVRMSVTDQGSGMADHVLPRVFEPFFTTKNNGEHKNMGLGLALSKNFVQAMGGRIEVWTQLHRGSRFTLCFPASVILHRPEMRPNVVLKELNHDGSAAAYVPGG